MWFLLKIGFWIGLLTRFYPNPKTRVFWAIFKTRNPGFFHRKPGFSNFEFSLIFKPFHWTFLRAFEEKIALCLVALVLDSQSQQSVDSNLNKLRFRHENMANFVDVSKSQNSPVWQYFLRSKETSQAKCKICDNVYKSSGSNTSTLLSHLNAKHNSLFICWTIFNKNS